MTLKLYANLHLASKSVDVALGIMAFVAAQMVGLYAAMGPFHLHAAVTINNFFNLIGNKTTVAMRVEWGMILTYFLQRQFPSCHCLTCVAWPIRHHPAVFIMPLLFVVLNTPHVVGSNHFCSTNHVASFLSRLVNRSSCFFEIFDSAYKFSDSSCYNP